MKSHALLLLHVAGSFVEFLDVIDSSSTRARWHRADASTSSSVAAGFRLLAPWGEGWGSRGWRALAELMADWDTSVGAQGGDLGIRRPDLGRVDSIT